MDGIFNAKSSAFDNVSGLIRSANGGMCSDHQKGISYPGVPSVQFVLAKLNINSDEKMAESQWFEACEIVMPE